MFPPINLWNYKIKMNDKNDFNEDMLWISKLNTSASIEDMEDFAFMVRELMFDWGFTRQEARIRVKEILSL